MFSATFAGPSVHCPNKRDALSTQDRKFLPKSLQQGWESCPNVLSDRRLISFVKLARKHDIHGAFREFFRFFVATKLEVCFQAREILLLEVANIARHIRLE